jgi:ABC-type branched-subunit amino acid transport system substrate-binding protein
LQLGGLGIEPPKLPQFFSELTYLKEYLGESQFARVTLFFIPHFLYFVEVPMRRKNSSTLLVLITGLFLGLVNPVFAEEKTSIPIGVILPLSGEFASWGEGIRRAIELYAERGDSKFKFVFEDEGNCEARSSVAAYRKLSSS